MKDSKKKRKSVPAKIMAKKPGISLIVPLKVIKKPVLKLRPRKPFWSFQPRLFCCDACLPTAVPQVQIIANKRVVQVGEPFNIKVIGCCSVGLRAVWWFGRGTGIVEIDKAHWHGLAGETFYEEIWEGVTINQPGTFTLGANSRDVLYGVELGVPHQASEGAGISECIVEVRADISYSEQVNIVKAQYGKSDEWETWMKSAEIRARYEFAWERSRAVPTTLKLAFRYGGAPLAYDPPWEDEHQHMEVFDKMATAHFPGLNFELFFGADPGTTDMLIEVGGLGGISHVGNNYTYLYYETIFGHEFGHVLNIQHHYPGADISTTIFMPPGETECVMARNSTQYCSGCRAAMHLDLNADTSAELSAIGFDILTRYPY